MKCIDEISVGDYVRTDKGIITKAQEHFIDGLLNGKSAFGKAVKHSKNIIDLVCEGDYVNGKRVIKANCRFTYIDDDSSYGESEIENGLDLGDELIYWSSEIESIITKEQIKQIEFIIKE